VKFDGLVGGPLQAGADDLTTSKGEVQ
jgi:hypothetical protein